MDKKFTVFLILLLSTLFVSVQAHATPVFSYEIWMQAETSLDMGPITVHGKIRNSGTATLDLTTQWAALGGLPGDMYLTVSGLEFVNQQFDGNILHAGEDFDFIWLTGTIEEDFSSRSGEYLEGSVGLIPYGSDWTWHSGGFIPELLVRSEWVNGAANTDSWNITTISLETAGQYINHTPLEPVPEPSTVLLIGTGLAGMVGLRRKLKK